MPQGNLKAHINLKPITGTKDAYLLVVLNVATGKIRFSTKIRVPIKDWNGEKSEVKRSHPNFSSLNGPVSIPGGTIKALDNAAFFTANILFQFLPVQLKPHLPNQHIHLFKEFQFLPVQSKLGGAAEITGSINSFNSFWFN